MKKFLALLLSMVMLAAPMGVFAYSDIEEGTVISEAVTILSNLEILEGFEDGTFRPDQTVTRAEMAKIICKVVGHDNIIPSEITYPDVPTSHWAAGYIAMATGLKIINGFTDGTFRPEEPVTYEQMIKMIVAALGYIPKAENNGGYPTGYLIIAAQEKINVGATGNAGDPATRGVVAKAIYNALTVKLMEQTGFKNDEPTYEVVDKTLLKDALRVDVIDSVVTASPLQGSSIKDNTVKFEANNLTYTTYESDKVNSADYLGKSVLAYTKQSEEDDKWYLVAITEKAGKNNVITLDYEQIEAYTTDISIDYVPVDSSVITDIELNGTDTKYYYNGRVNKAKADVFLSTPAPGLITIIDNNNDDKYDYIFVTEYENDYVVSYVGSNKITDKNDASIPLIDMRDENRIIVFYKDGKVIDYNDIKENDVLTLAPDDTKVLINVYVSSAFVEGTVTEKGTETDSYWTIDGEKFRLSATNAPTVAIGDKGTFYLNVDNRVVYKELTSSTSEKYAYMFAAYVNEGLGGKIVEIKFLTSEDVWVTADVAKNIKVYNGSTTAVRIADSAQEGVDAGIYAISSGQAAPTQTIFKYTTNASKEINAIYLPVATSDVNNFSLDASGVDSTFNKQDYRIGSTFFVKDSIVFSVPDSYSDKEEDFTVTKASTVFEDKNEYTYAAYDITDGYPNVTVVSGHRTVVDDATRVLVINSLTKGSDQNGNDVSIVYGLQNGTEVSAVISDEIAFYNRDNSANSSIDVDDLAPGDVVTFSVNSKNEIDKIKVLMSYADAVAAIATGKAGAAVGIYEDTNATGQYEVVDMFGFAAKKESGNILSVVNKYIESNADITANLVNANEGKPVMYRPNVTTNYYEINTERTKVTPAVSSYADLEVELAKSTADYAYVGSWVYIRKVDGIVIDCVIYTANNPM